MKRKLLIFVGCLFVFFSSCSSSKFKIDTKTIEMSGNPTTGYAWVYSIEDDSIIQVEDNIKKIENNAKLGGLSLFAYTIKSLRPGKTNLTFEYKRPWEEKEAEKTKNIEVIVNTDGKMILTEKETSLLKKSFKSVSMAEGLKKDDCFNGTVYALVDQTLYKMNIDSEIETCDFIQSKVSRQYLNQYHQCYGMEM